MLSIKCFYNSNYKWNLWLNFGILTILLVFACFSHLSSLCPSSSRLLLAPNFVSSFTQGDFVYFFFRETAVEFINCGKVSGWVTWVYNDIDIDMDMDIDIDECGMLMHVAIIECGQGFGQSDSSGSASTSTPYLGGHFARLCLHYSCTLPASTWATEILVFRFWFRLWSMAKYSYRFWNGRLICLWAPFVSFLFGIL